jgi:hypothetical protein
VVDNASLNVLLYTCKLCVLDVICAFFQVVNGKTINAFNYLLSENAYGA